MGEKRPVFSEELGEFFTSLRVAKGWNQSEAANIAQRRKLKVTYQTIRGLEAGQTKNADPDDLRAIAKLYDHPYALIAATVFRHRFGVVVQGSDLIWQTVDTLSALSSEGASANDPASARILELEQIVRDQQAALEKVENVAHQLIQVAKIRGQGDRVAVEGSRGRGRDRKTR